MSASEPEERRHPWRVSRAGHPESTARRLGKPLISWRRTSLLLLIAGAIVLLSVAWTFFGRLLRLAHFQDPVVSGAT